jgi:hypothetical protein
MGVPIHGQRDGRVAGEHLSDFGRDVGGDEVGDESVPQRVKIGFAPARVGGKQEAGLLAIGPFLWILRLIDPRHSGRSANCSISASKARSRNRVLASIAVMGNLDS